METKTERGSRGSRLSLALIIALGFHLNACDSKDAESDGGEAAGAERAGESAGVEMAGESAGAEMAGESAGAGDTAVAPEGLKISGPASANAHDVFTLSAELLLDGGDTEALSGEPTWESLNPNARVSETGEVTVMGEGELEIKASFDGLEGVWSLTAGCVYPEPRGERYTTSLAHGNVLPPLTWVDSYNAKSGSLTDVSLKDIHCKANYQWVSTINFLTTTGWCPFCPEYMSEVANMNPELKQAGGLLIYVEVQDNDYAPADSDFAYNHLNRLLGSTEGYFVGDLNSQPLSRFFGRTISTFPDAYVVRRRDMTILTSQNLNRDNGMVPFVRIAEDPEQDWSTYEPAPFESICEEGDDEPSEPNDSFETAGLLEEGMSSAGICTAAPDFFKIETEGSWELTINFQHSEADLDLYQLNPANPEGEPLQGSNGETNSESLTGEGPATLVVVSFTRTSALYTINLTTTP